MGAIEKYIKKLEADKKLLEQKLADLAVQHMQNLEAHGEACREDEREKLQVNK